VIRGAVSLIQRFGSAANLSIHLHCVVRNQVDRSSKGVRVFHEAHAPTSEHLQDLLGRNLTRIVKGKVCPGFVQLAAFIPVKLGRHIKAQSELHNLALGNREQAEATMSFHDAYFTVPDLPAEAYLETQGPSSSSTLCRWESCRIAAILWGPARSATPLC